MELKPSQLTNVDFSTGGACVGSGVVARNDDHFGEEDPILLTDDAQREKLLEEIGVIQWMINNREKGVREMYRLQLKDKQDLLTALEEKIQSKVVPI